MLLPFGFSPLPLWLGSELCGAWLVAGVKPRQRESLKKSFIQSQQDPKVRGNALPLAHPSDLADISQAGESLGDGTLGFSTWSMQCHSRWQSHCWCHQALNPSLVPSFGCSPWGCPHRWPRPGFFHRKNSSAGGDPSSGVWNVVFLHQRRHYRDSQCKVKTATDLWHTGRHQHSLSWSFHMGLTFFPAPSYPGRCCARSGITWNSQLHRGSVLAQNWHELQRKHLGSSTGMWLCHPHSH